MRYQGAGRASRLPSVRTARHEHQSGGVDWRRPSPQEGTMASLLVIIPALNEAATIQKVIGDIPGDALRDTLGVQDVQVLVVNDGSTDNTAELAREAGAHVASHPRNCGVGAAVQTGLAFAVEHDFDVAVNIDADGQFGPSWRARRTSSPPPGSRTRPWCRSCPR
jgi:cellulose synthase/poly-beta-1,6-N-acetylglucosamine synthase-like glycosyltransferase